MKSSITVLHTGFMQVNTLFVPCRGGFFVTDPGGDADEISAFFDSLHVPPQAIVLTHGHFDHIAGLKDLLKIYPDVPVVIHSADTVYLGSGGIQYHMADFERIGLGDFITENAQSLPSETQMVADGDSLFGWKVIHTPGHTQGSICLYSEEDGLLVSGDTLFCNGYGRTDLYGGSIDQLFASLNKLRVLPPETHVYPGHGTSTTIAAELS